MDASVGVVVGRSATELELYAAKELCRYLKTLFGIYCQPASDLPKGVEHLFLVGSRQTNPAGPEAFPELSDQGILLRRTEFMGSPALIVGGGSPKATLWAVYDLVERWGVRFLLSGDVLPERPGELLPGIDMAAEPALRVRQWRRTTTAP